MKEYVSLLPPPAPPIPVKTWESETPQMKCPVCGETFTVKQGLITCPKCNSQYIVSEWNWNSFIIGLGVGLLIGLIISIGIYYFVFRPYVPIVKLATTIGEIARKT